MSNRTSKRILAVTLALLAAQLAACGGGGGGGGSTTPPGSSAPPGGNNPPGGGDNNPPPGGDDDDGGTPPGELASGTFVDAPVAGLSYTTSSEITGVTDADGRYDYRVGDTVTFSLGSLVLGTVPGQGVVTPMTVANALVANTSTDPATVAVNLLVLLQSLDSNGNPDDGITFTQAIRDAVVANSIDLTAADAAFTSSLATFVSNVSGATGLSLTPVDREDAVTHFVGQAPTALAGVYVRADADFAPVTDKIVTLTMFRSGKYLLGGQYDNAECELGDSDGTPKNDLVFSDARGNGVEYGAYEWNPLTQAFTVNSANVSIETDGFCGFNEPIVDATNDTTELEITTQGLVFRDAEGNVTERFARLQSERTGIAGTWVQPTALMNGQPFVFSMFPSSEDGKTGRYLMVDASLPSPEDTSPGIEQGCYSIDANDNVTVELNSSLCANAVDTNDTAGMSHAESGAKLLIDENDRLMVVEGEDVTGFARLPVEQLSIEKLSGAWVIQLQPEVDLGDQDQLAMLTVFDDGRFLFGTHHDDPSCIAGDYIGDLTQEAGGNGLEYGTLAFDKNLVRPVTTKDTNGECGLYDQHKGTDQRYLIAPSADGDALVLWANDEEDPAGMVLKRVPTVDNEIYGAWVWRYENDPIDQLAVVAYLPGGYMFEVSTFTGWDGLLREKFTIAGDTMTSYRGTYDKCVDTESPSGEDNNCDSMEPLVEEYFVEGDTMIDDDDEGTITRIRKD